MVIKVIEVQKLEDNVCVCVCVCVYTHVENLFTVRNSKLKFTALY
jgi:hypothetical protein